MGDEPRIPIESKITTARDQADPGHGAPGHYVSTHRVVRGPGRRSRLVGVAAVVGLLAGGLLWWASDGEGDDDGGGEAACGIAGDRKVSIRSASTVEGPSSERWALRISASPSLPETAAGAYLVLSERRDPGDTSPNAAGPCVIRATLPAADRQDGHAHLPAGADLLVTFDEDGDIARIVVMGEPQASAPSDAVVRPVEPERPRVSQP